VRSAGIVLAGGRSTRMGRPKATLEWHGSTLVRRAAGLAGRVVDGPVVVVRAEGQELPALPAGVEVAQDARAARGPLQGIAAGLAVIGARADVVFVCAVDVPLLHPALARHVIASLAADDEIALPEAHGFPHPLAAAYRTTVARHLHDLLREDRLGTRALLARCRVRRLDAAALLADPAVAAADPELHSLLNLNEPAEYDAARARPAPAITVTGRGDVRAATLAQAGEGPATVNGRPTSDPEEPLFAGDVVAFVMRRRYRTAS
jgi:molybdopterin-guanine dinucleotide biosynthesis protein A